MTFLNPLPSIPSPNVVPLMQIYNGITPLSRENSPDEISPPILHCPSGMNGLHLMEELGKICVWPTQGKEMCLMMHTKKKKENLCQSNVN